MSAKNRMKNRGSLQLDVFLRKQARQFDQLFVLLDHLSFSSHYYLRSVAVLESGWGVM